MRSRRLTDPETGQPYANQAEKSRTIRAREAERTNAENGRRANEAQYDGVRRLDVAADVMRGVRSGGTGYGVPVQLATTPASATVRQFGGLSPENIPAGQRPGTGVITDADLAAQKYQRETGCDIVTAIQHVQTTRPDLTARHRLEVNAAVDRFTTQRGTQADVTQLDQLVEAHVRQHGTSYGDAIIAVSREHRDLGDRRNRALTLPIVNGIALADR